ncbi:MAG TPA: FecR domain-containing protein [Arachidicoccus soli]|nr:FecR domain-containing protein [Arachidicoccus soli]
MDKQRLKILFQKKLENTISESEKKEFFDLLVEPNSLAFLRALSKEIDISENLFSEMTSEATQRVWNNIQLKKVAHSSRSLFLSKVKWSRVAALILVFLMIAGGYQYFFAGNKKVQVTKAIVGNQIIKDAMPGHTGAILKLSNGDSYLLDTTHNGCLTKGIVKSSQALCVKGAGDTAYATLTTPIGRQQKLKLSDGTLVWLNAGSSIHFPLLFNKDIREVEITGEVYFEVVHKRKQPFIVKAGNQEIQDLGTHFDVNAYRDESSIKTTLLEGRVQVNRQLLEPGQQYSNGKITKVDAGASIAWVSGYFQFERADIKTIMRQIARWYNVKVNYEGKIPNQLFGGEIQRSLKLSQLLELLTGTGIHYTLDSNKLTIRP